VKQYAAEMGILIPKAKCWVGEDLKHRIWMCFIGTLQYVLKYEKEQNIEAPDFGLDVGETVEYYDFDLSALHGKGGDDTWFRQWVSSVNKEYQRDEETQIKLEVYEPGEVLERLTKLLVYPHTKEALDEAALLVSSKHSFC
jgi:hypothetical protein